MAGEKDFFVSYTQADRQWAEWVAWQLEQKGYQTIIQAWDFPSGSNFIMEMEKALQDVKGMIAILSSSYLNAPYTQAEWTTMFTKDPTGIDRKLIPVRVRECDLNGRLLATIGYIDLVDLEEVAAREKLLNRIEGKRIKPSVSPPFPGSTKPAFPGKHTNSSNVEDYSSTSTEAKSDKYDRSREVHSSARLLTAAPGTTVFTYTAHADWVGSVAWSPDGKQIASAGGDGTVRIWSADSGHTSITYHGHSSKHQPHAFTWVWKALWSPDGQHIASSGSDTTVRVWKACTGEDLFLYRGHATLEPMTHIFALVWSPDGMRIASASNAKHPDQAVHIWNAHTGSTILKYTGHALSNVLKTFMVTDLSWSPNGQYIASSGSDKNVKKWKLDPTTTNKSVQVWRPTGEHILTCGGDPICNGVAWSPDSKWIAAGYNKVVVIWDVATGKDVYTYTGHTKEVRAVAWSPDGSIIASASNDRTVHLWHPSTGKLPVVYRKHTDKVGVLAWSPDGKRIASAGADKTVQIWQAVEK